MSDQKMLLPWAIQSPPVFPTHEDGGCETTWRILDTDGDTVCSDGGYYGAWMTLEQAKFVVESVNLRLAKGG